MKITVIDGQGGNIGRQLVKMIRERFPEAELAVVGTNSVATANMLKGGAENGATGENAVIVACRKADLIIGPIGIISADSLLGEITPAMAVAIGQSRAMKLLLPVSHCNNQVIGVQSLTMKEMVAATVERLKELC